MMRTHYQRDLNEIMRLIRNSRELALSTLKILNKPSDVDKIGEVLIGCGIEKQKDDGNPQFVSGTRSKL